MLTRLMVEVADDGYLADALVLKGGTCLHKLWLPEPWRYSKDLDYARTESSRSSSPTTSNRLRGSAIGRPGCPSSEDVR